MDNKLLKLLDIDFYQKIQDRLASEFGIASVITDVDGNPLTRPSNFNSFCIDYVRKSPIGLKNCKYCDALGGISAKKFMKPVIYTCHTGLTDFASPIIINNELVGCFLCGQILTNTLPENHFEKVFKKLNLSSDNFDEVIKKIRILPFEKVEYFANFLFEISTKISNFSYYQGIGSNASETFEKNFEDLFKILILNDKEKQKNMAFIEKLKLTIFKNFTIKKDDIIQNIEEINQSFTKTENNLKDFNTKLKNFKL